MPVVVIKSPRYVPGLGQGPINEPTYVSDEFYRQLILQNFLVLKVPENTVYFDNAVSEDTVKEEPEEVVEEPVVEEKPVEESAIEEEKEDTTEEDENSVVTVQGEPVDVESMTKNELKKLLDKHEVEYVYKDNRKSLIKKVMNEIAD